MHPFPAGMMVRGVAAAAAATTWDPSFNTAATYTNVNRTVSGGGDAAIRGTTARSTGKYYFEITCTTKGSAGIVLASQIDTTYPGSNSGANGCMVYSNFYYGKNGGSISGMVAGNVLGVAVDLDGRAISFTSNGNALVTDTIAAGAMCPACDGAAGGDYTLATTSFTQAIPAGYSAWG